MDKTKTHPRKFVNRTLAAALALAMLFLTTPALVRGDDYNSLLKEGNRLYEEGKYDDALTKYREAQIERPEAPEVQYNIGSALYREGAFEEAAKVTGNSLTTDKATLEANAHYNMGNALYRQKKYPEAIEAYKQSLSINPDDVDAKFNLELARKMLKEQMKPQEQQQQQQQQDKQKQQQQQEQDKNQDNKDQQQQQKQQQQEEQDKQGEKNQQQQSREEADSTQQQQGQQAEPVEGLTKEDAERILDALKDEQQHLQKEIRQGRSTPSHGGKDW